MNSTHDNDFRIGRGPRGHRHGGPQADDGHTGPHGHDRRARHGGFGPRGGRGFSPGGPSGRGSRARKGDVRSAILSLLAEAPASGYGLMKAITVKTNDAWRPSPGSVYPTLAQLVDEQLIEATDPAAPRSDFALTDAGRAYVSEHAEQIEAAWDIDSADERGQLRGSVMKLMGAVRQFGATATPEQATRAVEKIDQLRKELYAILGE